MPTCKPHDSIRYLHACPCIKGLVANSHAQPPQCQSQGTVALCSCGMWHAEEDLNRAFGSGPSSIEIDKMRQQAQQAIAKQQAAVCIAAHCSEIGALASTYESR
eukprot:scaffold89995_cov19-Tisochrysis_lutea.AAC.2